MAKIELLQTLVDNIDEIEQYGEYAKVPLKMALPSGKEYRTALFEKGNDPKNKNTPYLVPTIHPIEWRDNKFYCGDFEILTADLEKIKDYSIGKYDYEKLSAVYSILSTEYQPLYEQWPFPRFEFFRGMTFKIPELMERMGMGNKIGDIAREKALVHSLEAFIVNDKINFT